MSSVAAEESELLNDAKYRLYVTSIDKALKSFEYTSEWADLISALGKLNKILLNHTKYPVIPRRMKISKRLAQCLHPALPSGVHLKALETYDIMFRTMGTNRLSQELFIYSSGLFPVLGHAATNVKPPLLGIYETHFIPLGEKLGPGLNGFLSGVLPGLEEGTEYYDRTNLLLEKVCSGVNPFLFYSCLWDCLISNAAVRLPAIIFILSHFNKHIPMEEQIFLMGNNIDAVVSGLSSCFQDESVLIQRSALDFLLVAFPMHNTCLSKSQCQYLITSVLLTLLKRDMSLNRRLFAWFLGSEVTSNAVTRSLSPSHTETSNDNHDIHEFMNEKYFETYSKDLLISAIKCVLKKATGQNPHDLRPYRILISLLDKSDIGPLILDDILFEVFRLLYLCWQEPGDRASNGAELLKSANLLFSSLEPRYLWQYVGTQFSETCCKIPTCTDTNNNESDCVKPVDSGDPLLQEVCSIIVFLLDSLSLEIYSETFSDYLPSLFLHIITSATEHCDAINSYQMNASMKLCLKILSKIRSPLPTSQSDLMNGNENTNNFSVFQNLEQRPVISEPGKVVQLTKSNNSPMSFSEEETTQDDNSSGSAETATNDEDNSSPLSNDITIVPRNDEETDNSYNVIISEEHLEKELTTMEKCLRDYKKFFVTFVHILRLKLGDTKSISNLFELLMIKSSETMAEDRIRILEALLRRILHTYKALPNFESEVALCSCSRDEKDSSECLFANYHVKDKIGDEWTGAVHHASKLLIELSTFETSLPSSIKSNDKIPKNMNEDEIPDWLKSLIVCCCWLGNVCVPLQLATMETLLDLAILCRRTEIHKRRYSSPSKSHMFSSSSETANGSEQVVTVVVFLPLLTVDQLTFIEYRSNVFQVMMHWLWLHLDDTQYEVKAAELICQLQNLLQKTDVIENCIEETLSPSQPASQRLHSFRKFVRLWHISREITKEADSLRLEETFYRCMLKIVDHLLINESSCLKLEAENWLFHSLLRGDCGRIMEPLLLILFDRRTARIGISYAKIQQHLQCDNAQIVDTQNNSIVYAICSVYGSALTYHLVKNAEHSFSYLNASKSNQDAGITITADTGNQSIDEGDSSDSEAGMSTTETIVVEEHGLDSTSASFDAMSISSSKTIPCQEYVKKLPYVQNISVFVNRGDTSPSVEDSLETLQSNGPQSSISDTELAKDQCVNGEFGNESSEYSDSSFTPDTKTLPLIKERLSKSESKINERVNSYSSLKDATTVSSTSSELEHTNSNEVQSKSTQVSISRAFHSSNAVDNECNGISSNDTNFPRSSSFSASETSNNSLMNCKLKAKKLQSLVSNSGTNIMAKAIVEDIITQIVDSVVEIKKPNNRSSVEKEEEADSAISCNSGCSSVTLEYEKDNSSIEDDEHVCKRIAEELGRKSVEKNSSNMIGVQFFSHMLLYCDIYDKNRVLYTLQKFKDIIAINARSFLFVASTTVVPAKASLVNLLMKHRNSIFARGFQSNEKSSDTFHKNTTYLEVLITVCLYYIRSYYPNFGSPGISNKDIFENKQVQIASIDLLTEIFFQLGGILARHENDMTSTVRELLNRCKVQKLALHCTWCCLCDHISGNVHDFVREILVLNRINEQPDEDSIEYSRAFQIQYLRLLLSLIILENEIYRKEDNNINVVENKNDFIDDKPIIHQPLFFNLLKQMLESKELRRPAHERVISFVVACLPFMKKALSKTMTNVIRQVCCNLEAAAVIYQLPNVARSKQKIPFNYTVTLLDALTILSHYCLLEFNSQAVLKALSDAISLRTFKGLFQMYSDFPNSTNFCGSYIHGHNNEAKEAVLENLPKIFAAVSFLWQSITSLKSGDYNNVAGSLPQVKSQILNLLNPIANHHSIHFFISVAVVWKERANLVDNASQKLIMIPEANKDQLVLVHLLCSLTSITSDLLISSIHRIFKQRVVFNQERSGEIEMSVLEVLVHYIQLISVPKLIECWNSLVPLLREASSITPQSQFLLCAAVSQFVNRLPSTPDRLMDKKDFKDLQDIIIKLVEITTQTAGAGLEQTTWLRRNLAVRENASSSNSGVGSVLTSGILFSKDNDKLGAHGAQFSAAAQLVLAQLLIPMLDVIFNNQDKEKCVNLLINVMYNITPYLRNHTSKNAANFYACSQLLASISCFQYTRKAWKKDAMDLLLDSNLFQMEIKSLKHWRTIVDNLMSQDISTFRDLLGRVSINQNNTLNLFSSKDQEYELRSHLLKRLAFVILCCEQDQFHKHMPDIQEKLSDSLKLPQSTPGIQAQVFLCFRVLLLRMSPHHMTSLWPVIITEMVQVMLQMENELSTDIEESNSQSRSLGLDWSWSSGSTGSGNNSQGSSHPHWLQLQLAAAKLLKLAVQLPADRLPQFQMYRWAFVGKYQKPSSPTSATAPTCNSFGASVDFVPHVIRIASLMNSKYGNPPEKVSYDNLLPAAYQVKTLQDLHSFFATLSFDYVFGEKTVIAAELENEIEMDFIE